MDGDSCMKIVCIKCVQIISMDGVKGVRGLPSEFFFFFCNLDSLMASGAFSG